METYRLGIYETWLKYDNVDDETAEPVTEYNELLNISYEARSIEGAAKFLLEHTSPCVKNETNKKCFIVRYVCLNLYFRPLFSFEHEVNSGEWYLTFLTEKLKESEKNVIIKVLGEAVGKHEIIDVKELLYGRDYSDVPQTDNGN